MRQKVDGGAYVRVLGLPEGLPQARWLVHSKTHALRSGGGCQHGQVRLLGVTGPCPLLSHSGQGEHPEASFLRALVPSWGSAPLT